MEVTKFSSCVLSLYLMAAHVVICQVTLNVSPDIPYEMDSELTLTCSSELENLNPGTLELWKDGMIIARDADIVSPTLQNSTRVEIQYERSLTNPLVLHFRASLQLSLSRVSRYDSGVYQCSINATVRDEANYTVFYSESELVTIRYYPDPICSSSAVIQKGKESLVYCSLVYDETNAPVDVHWMATADTVNLTALSRENLTRVNGSVTSKLTLLTMDSDINGELICEVSNDFVSKNCSTHVKTIWPSLSIYPTEISVDFGGEALFTCKLQFPVTFDPKWEWNITPRKEQARVEYISSSVSTFTIRELRAQDNGAIVSCFAFLDGRWSRADAKLYVSYGTSDPVTSGGASDSSAGWRAGFGVVFIVMLVAIGAIVYLVWRFHSHRDSFSQLQHQTGENSEHCVETAAQKNSAVTAENYMALQNPRYSNLTGNTESETQKTYTDLIKPGDKLQTGGLNETVYTDTTDEVYVNEVPSATSADDIYDYAEEGDDEEQLYGNQTMIGYNQR